MSRLLWTNEDYAWERQKEIEGDNPCPDCPESRVTAGFTTRGFRGWVVTCENCNEIITELDE